MASCGSPRAIHFCTFRAWLEDRQQPVAAPVLRQELLYLQGWGAGWAWRWESQSKPKGGVSWSISVAWELRDGAGTLGTRVKA